MGEGRKPYVPAAVGVPCDHITGNVGGKSMYPWSAFPPRLTAGWNLIFLRMES